MVNYQYDLAEIERNHEAFANQDVVAASSVVKQIGPRRADARVGDGPPAPGA